MSIKGKILGAALDLTKNENMQNKTANLLGMLFPYVGIRKEAVDCYISEIEKSDLSPESKAFAIYNTKKTFKKFKNQQDIVQIALENAKEGTDFSENSKVNEEWFNRFMESAGYVSDDDIKLIWGKILAKEYEEPGSTPFNMTRILSEITPRYAEVFKNICSMRRITVVVDDEGKEIVSRDDVVVPFENNSGFFGKVGIYFNSLCELETLGLIKFDSFAGYTESDLPKGHILTYVNGVTKEIKGEKDNIPCGNVMLTSSGNCLKNIIEQEKINNYEDIESNYMKEQRIDYIENSNFLIKVDGENYYIEKIDK